MQLCRRLLLCCGQSGAERVVLVAELHILLEQALVFDGQGRLLGGQGGLLGPQALHQLLHLVHVRLLLIPGQNYIIEKICQIINYF